MKTLQQTTTVPSLTFCIVMDLIGCLSFALPGIGEFSDVVWAPLSAFIFFKIIWWQVWFYGCSFKFCRRGFALCRFHPDIYDCAFNEEEF